MELHGLQGHAGTCRNLQELAGICMACMTCKNLQDLQGPAGLEGTFGRCSFGQSVEIGMGITHDADWSLNLVLVSVQILTCQGSCLGLYHHKFGKKKNMVLDGTLEIL